MSKQIQFKDPETKKKLSFYNALKDNNLEMLQRIWELGQEDHPDLFNKRISNFTPIEWGIKNGSIEQINFVIEKGGKFKTGGCADKQLMILYRNELIDESFPILQLLCNHNEGGVLKLVPKFLTPKNYRRKVFQMLMFAPNTREEYIKYNLGNESEICMCKKYDCEKWGKKFMCSEMNEFFYDFWKTILQLDDDVFTLLDEWGYKYNILEILDRITDYCYVNMMYNHFLMKESVLMEIINRIDYDLLSDEDKKKYLNNLKRIMVLSKSRKGIINQIFLHFADKLDFNKSIKYTLNTIHFEVFKFSISLNEFAIKELNIPLLKKFLKYSDLKSESILYYTFNEGFGYYGNKKGIKNGEKQFKMYNFLIKKWEEQMFEGKYPDLRYCNDSFFRFTDACKFLETVGEKAKEGNKNAIDFLISFLLLGIYNYSIYLNNKNWVDNYFKCIPLDLINSHSDIISKKIKHNSCYKKQIDEYIINLQNAGVKI